MPRPCGPCGDPLRNEIDRRLLKMVVSRETFRDLSRIYGYSEDSLARHVRSHLSQTSTESDVRGLMIAAREQALKEAEVRETVRETPGGVGVKAAAGAEGDATKKTRSKYIKLKEPADVLSYVQRLINRLRDEGLEIDSKYLGKITSLLTTWLVAYKANLESVEIQQLREEINELRTQIEASNGYGRRVQNP